MCTSNIYTWVHPDGRSRQTYQPTLCSASVNGQPCINNVMFQHPSQFVPYESTSPYMTQLPPTPQYSPAPSTPLYRSGDESDHSYGSNSSKKNKRSSGIYVNGTKVLDLNRREGHRRERIVLVDNPPTPRTPPQTWAAPHTAPPSPNANVYLDASPGRRRPVIVDERTRPERHVQIEVVDNKRRSSHSRHTSTSSRESLEDEEKRRRRRQREKEREEQEQRAQRIRARIAEANAEIAGRPTVPMAPAPRRASTYKRPEVEIPLDPETALVKAVRRLNFEEAQREKKARRLAEKEERKEDEAQRQRLRERIMPGRRATVAPGSRRHRVLYDDGVYRWE
ncbi:hypothetical protein EDB81DRAFT_119056 [Dactylonectria macrodidyma]|uniref:Uncharacterized protein n=1 Tax=Dactylonectria macrodidyma TaxID=307937 RepID=A0A9P9E917_9HYPO|nr:hypothetical protein EDB81DRAFT_119056 [Dactylonectria macrodidyma]